MFFFSALGKMFEKYGGECWLGARAAAYRGAAVLFDAKQAARNVGLELGRRDSSTMWRRGWCAGIQAWSSAGGIAILFGAEDGAEEAQRREERVDFT